MSNVRHVAHYTILYHYSRSFPHILIPFGLLSLLTCLLIFLYSWHLSQMMLHYILMMLISYFKRHVDSDSFKFYRFFHHLISEHQFSQRESFRYFINSSDVRQSSFSGFLVGLRVGQNLKRSSKVVCNLIALQVKFLSLLYARLV